MIKLVPIGNGLGEEGFLICGGSHLGGSDVHGIAKIIGSTVSREGGHAPWRYAGVRLFWTLYMTLRR